MRAGNRERALAAWLLFAFASVIFDMGALRVLAWLPLILYLPGRLYLTAAGIETAGTAESALLSVCASVMNVVLGGFVLGSLRLMTPVWWAVWLVSSCAFLSFRAARAAGEERAVEAVPAQAGRGPERRHLELLALAAAGAVAAFVIAIHDEAADRQFRFTQFWMVPRSGASQVIAVGVRNEEPEPATYEIEFALDARALESWPSFRLTPGEETVRDFFVPLLKKGRHRVEARLFKDGDRARLYRRAFIEIETGGD